jgi:DNA-binding transcriptional regulator YhcF (GntR family)
MEFKGDKSIFQQIGDSICDKIMKGELVAQDRVESVRELAALSGVNQNTILRTYMELQREGIIENMRGIGFFVTDLAKEIIQKKRLELFYKEILPEFIKQADLLQIDKDQLISIITNKN